ncbi:MAG TPA: hypothetical protein VGN12_28695 [Pirellulales bacterium]|jgi:hypothetical protein
MVKRIVQEVVRYGVVYATSGVVGLGVMAWMTLRAHRTRNLNEGAAVGDTAEHYLAP